MIVVKNSKHIKGEQTKPVALTNTVTTEKSVVKKLFIKTQWVFSNQMKVTDTQQIQQNVQMCHSLIQKAKQRINCKAMNSNDK